MALRNLIEDNSDSFATTLAEFGTTDFVMHEINTGNAAPIRQRCYNQPPQITSEINRQIDEQFRNSPTEEVNAVWNSIIMVTKTKDHNLRICLDYRKLNSTTEGFHFSFQH